MTLIRYMSGMLLSLACVAAPPAAARSDGPAPIALPSAPPGAVMLLMQSSGPQCPANGSALRGTGASVSCYCPASATSGGTVWGTDVYTDDSAICAAARHAGVIGAVGGIVTFSMRSGLAGYNGTLRNGVASSNYGPWDGSFVFSRAGATAAAGSAPALASCPMTATQLRGDRRSISCLCTAAATATQGSVWGSDVYTDDSAICRAALHAGVIGRSGGAVTITTLPGRSAYSGSSRNGVSTSEYGSWQGSFTIGK